MKPEDNNPVIVVQFTSNTCFEKLLFFFYLWLIQKLIKMLKQPKILHFEHLVGCQRRYLLC
jgi:hypothetical protein